MKKEPNQPSPTPDHSKRFGDSQLGEGLGCAAAILAVGISIALIIWAASH